MVNRELDYIDSSDYDALRHCVVDAPIPAPGTHTHSAAPAEIFTMPPLPSRSRGRPRKNPQHPPVQSKRSCVRITIQQRKNLLAAFRERGDDKTPIRYTARLGITVANVANLLVKLRRIGLDLDVLDARCPGVPRGDSFN